MWSDVDLKMDTQNTCTRDMLKRDSTTCSNMLTILDSTFNMIERNLCDHLMSRRITFINVKDIYMNFKKYRENEYGH